MFVGHDDHGGRWRLVDPAHQVVENGLGFDGLRRGLDVNLAHKRRIERVHDAYAARADFVAPGRFAPAVNDHAVTVGPVGRGYPLRDPEDPALAFGEGYGLGGVVHLVPFISHSFQ